MSIKSIICSTRSCSVVITSVFMTICVPFTVRLPLSRVSLRHAASSSRPWSQCRCCWYAAQHKYRCRYSL